MTNPFDDDDIPPPPPPTRIEIEMADDPLASPGNLSAVSGWSLNAGIMEQNSIGNPLFDEDNDTINDEGYVDDIDDDDKSTRSSSPRETQFKTHGLSMIKEEDRRGNIRSPTNGNKFDDVDLEAFAQNLPTANTNTSSPKPHEKNNDAPLGMTGWNLVRGSNGGNITHRVLHELKTNRNLKYKIAIGMSILLVSSCVIVITATASKSSGGNNQNMNKKQQEQPASLSELLNGLESESAVVQEEEETSIPSFNPTKIPTGLPSDKPNQLPSRSPVRIPTDDPTSNPSGDPTSLR